MKSVLFLGGKDIGFDCFSHLLEQRKELQFAVVGVFASPRGQRIVELAQHHKVPVFPALDALLKLPVADLLLSVQYHEILRAEHLAKARRAVNLHMAPLPQYRGCNQFSFAIVNQEKEFGTTLHEMDEKVDHGRVLFQSRFPISKQIFVKELYEKTAKESLQLFREALPALLSSQVLSGIDVASSGPQYFYRRSDIEKLKRIDLSWDQEKIERHIRATTMPGFPPPYVMLGDRKIELRLEDSP